MEKGDAGSNWRRQTTSIEDFVAIDDSGCFVNLKTGDVLDVAAMLPLFSQDELLQVPLGRRPLQQHQSAGRR